MGRGSLGDLELGVPGAAGQLLDRLPVSIAGREVHRRDIRPGTERLLDEADALEEVRPLEGREEPHARDDVADRHVPGDLPLMLGRDHLVQVLPVAGQAVVQPHETGRVDRVAVAEPLGQLHEERTGERLPVEALQTGASLLERSGPLAQEDGRERVRRGALAAPLHDSIPEAAQVLDEHEPE